jgi:hypothetical protein
MLDQAARLYKDALNKVGPNKNVPPHTFSSILATFGNPTWMDRHGIAYHHKITIANKKQQPTDNMTPPELITIAVHAATVACEEEQQILSELSDETTGRRNKGGRPPKSMGGLSYKEFNQKLDQARYIAATKYKEARDGDEGKKLGKGVLDEIITSSLKEVGLPDDEELIPKNTIINRVTRNNLKGKLGSFSQVSPMHEIEPLLAVLCRHLNRMAKSITQKEFMGLANDIIKDTPTSDKICKFQQSICGMKLEIPGQPNKLGKKYFYNFMARHDDIIHTTRISKRCVTRLEWATYTNVEKMYQLVYAELLYAGVAKALEEPVFSIATTILLTRTMKMFLVPQAT